MFLLLGLYPAFPEDCLTDWAAMPLRKLIKTLDRVLDSKDTDSKEMHKNSPMIMREKNTSPANRDCCCISATITACDFRNDCFFFPFFSMCMWSYDLTKERDGRRDGKQGRGRTIKSRAWLDRSYAKLDRVQEMRSYDSIHLIRAFGSGQCDSDVGIRMKISNDKSQRWQKKCWKEGRKSCWH